MDPELRAAVTGDVGALHAIAEEVITGAWSRRSIAEELARDVADVVVLERAGAAVGFAIAWTVAGETSLLLIAVRAAEQRRGAGRRLLEAIEARARARGGEVVHLEVRAGNTGARAFYRTHGYAEVGLRKGYYGDGTEDAVLMRRSLT